MRLDRDPPLYDVFRHFGSAKKVADHLGISTQAVSHWKKVPAKYIYALSQPTGIHPYKLRPDIYIESFWVSGMDTTQIAGAMLIEEAEVYRILGEVMERRRHKPNVEAIPAISSLGEPALESGLGEQGLSLAGVHSLAQNDNVGDKEPDEG
jgi:hypothetical protein